MWFIDWLSNPLAKIYLRRRYTQTVKNGASRHKINYIDILSEILNLEGHLFAVLVQKLRQFLLNGWTLPTGGVALGRVCPAVCAAGLFSFLVENMSPAIPHLRNSQISIHQKTLLNNKTRIGNNISRNKKKSCFWQARGEIYFMSTIYSK